jgi:two-component system NtrC family sensor kinase
MDRGMTATPGSAGGDQDRRRAAGSPADVLIDPRILVVDDNEAIHEDIRKILDLGGGGGAELNAMEADLFDDKPAGAGFAHFQIDSAYQGQEGLAKVQQAIAEHRPYAVAFVDVRMPPGWDGIETIGHLWREDPDLQVVICTAFSDHSWPEIVSKLAPADSLLILRKPFDAIEIRQMVHALSAKWMLNRELQMRLADLESSVQARTQSLVDANDQLRKEILTRARLESELVLAHRLESVGQQAAELAHGASGPVDSLGESVRTLRLAFEDITSLVGAYRRMLLGVTTLPGQGHLLGQMEQAEESANLFALQREVPRAFDQLVHGTKPVTELMNAVKEAVRKETGEHATGELSAALASVGGPRPTIERRTAEK